MLECRVSHMVSKVVKVGNNGQKKQANTLISIFRVAFLWFIKSSLFLYMKIEIVLLIASKGLQLVEQI